MRYSNSSGTQQLLELLESLAPTVRRALPVECRKVVPWIRRLETKHCQELYVDSKFSAQTKGTTDNFWIRRPVGNLRPEFREYVRYGIVRGWEYNLDLFQVVLPEEDFARQMALAFEHMEWLRHAYDGFWSGDGIVIEEWEYHRLSLFTDEWLDQYQGRICDAFQIVEQPLIIFEVDFTREPAVELVFE